MSMIVMCGVPKPIEPGAGGEGGTTHFADSCSFADVDAKVAIAVDGDTIVIPAGTAEWTSLMTITNGIKLQGAGSGEIVGDSATSLTVGTGSKVFTTQAGLDFVNGETITARYINRVGAHSMTGTVTSYSGTTLTLDVTSVTGSGTRIAWVFERNPASRTIITNSASDHPLEGMITITEPVGYSAEITGIKFVSGSTTAGWHVRVARNSGGQPSLIHHNWFDMTQDWTGGISQTTNRGVIWANTFTGELCTDSSLGCTRRVMGAVGVVDNTGALNDTWETVSTMGTDDSDGLGNLYVEDNYFLAFWQSLSGNDSGARIVWRNNVISNSTLGGHGADSADLGHRHAQIYDNRFVFDDLGGTEVPYNVNKWIDMRGGTFVVTDNVMPNITSSTWGDKDEITMGILNLRDNTGPNPCWGKDTGGAQYPVPRQPGSGYIDGTRLDGLGRNEDSVTKIGDLEPIYIWGNTVTPTIVMIDGTPSCGAGTYDVSADYIVLDREYYLSAKPGFAKYTYPHPLRAGG